MATPSASASPLPSPNPTGAVAAFSAVERPARWDVPFGDNIDESAIDALLAAAPFNELDPTAFPPNLPLRGLLRNDCRLLDLADGEIVVRAGDYGNSAFFILDGAVRVFIDPLPDTTLGRGEVRKKGFWAALSQLWNRPLIAEVRNLGRPSAVAAKTRSAQPHQRIPLADIPGLLGERRTVELKEGELFGEIAALGRTPRTSSIVASGPARLLEIRWQGLRELRRFDPRWQARLDRLYRERSLLVQLKETPWFADLDAESMKAVADATRFETFGRFDWHGSYRALKNESAANLLAHEPVIAREGEYLNGLLIVRSGFARLSRRYNHGERTLSYMGKGEIFGLAEFARHALHGTPVHAAHTLRALGYVDVLVIPTSIVERLILPRISREELACHAAAPGGEFLGTTAAALSPAPSESAGPMADAAREEDSTARREFLVENRFINGTASMVIDLDRCTRCDDCVRACASAHDNNPRFVRHGHVHDHLMVAQACMHCIDPVCMIGCPTGAIHRDLAGGQVVINDSSCVGCSTCANSCPYENIQMVPVRAPDGEPYVDKTTRQPIMKATKCDLCIDQLGGPACVRACPHDALTRVPLHQPEALEKWLSR